MKKRGKFLLAAGAFVGAATLLYHFLQRRRLRREINGSFALANAGQRREAVDGRLEYKVELVICPSGESYLCNVEICFDLKDAEDITLDYKKRDLEYLKINEKEVFIEEGLYAEGQIRLARGLLQKGKNVVVARTRSRFDRDDVGLMRSDSEGSGAFVYMVLGPNCCSLVFPCFDQPDIKAVFRLRVIVPQDWVVLSNERIASCPNVPVSGDFLRTQGFAGSKDVSFMASRPISTNFFAFAAGNFISRKTKRTFKGIFPEFFFRSDKAKSIDVLLDEFLICIVEALEIFTLRFSRYPASKLNFYFMDCVTDFVPSPGCVYYPEWVTRTPKHCHDKLEQFVSIIAAVAACWFGYVTTPRTWRFLAFQSAFCQFLALVVLGGIRPHLKNLPLCTTVFEALDVSKDSLFYASLESAYPLFGQLMLVDQPKFILKPMITRRGAWILRYLFRLWGTSRFWEITRELATSQTSGNVDFSDFLAKLRDFERAKVEALFSQARVDIVDLHRKDGKLRVSPAKEIFEWEHISLVEYVIVSGKLEARPRAVNLRAGAEFVLSSDAVFFTLNEEMSGFFLYRDEEPNVNQVVAHADSLSELALVSYFINLGHRAVICNEVLPQFFDLSVKLLNRTSLLELTSTPLDLIETVLLKFARDEDKKKFLPLIFDKLLKLRDVAHAVKFVSSVSDLQKFEPEFHSYKTHEKAILLMKNTQFGTERARLLPVEKELEDFFASHPLHREVLSILQNEEKLNGAWNEILFRTEGKSIWEYQSKIRMLLPFVRRNVRLTITDNFLFNFPTLLESNSKMYIFMLIKEIIPDFRVENPESIADKLAHLIKSMANRPSVQFVLRNRLEVFLQFNQL